MYRALESGNVDVISAFSSDGRIAAWISWSYTIRSRLFRPTTRSFFSRRRGQEIRRCGVRSRPFLERLRLGECGRRT